MPPRCCAGPDTTMPSRRPASAPTWRSACAAGEHGCAASASCLEPLEPRAITLTLLTPPLHCSTPVVYRTWDELGGPRGDHGNDLEPAALAAYPELAVHRDRLAAATGRRPRLAGSGSTWFVEGAWPGPGHVVTRTRTTAPV